VKTIGGTQIKPPALLTYDCTPCNQQDEVMLQKCCDQCKSYQTELGFNPAFQGFLVCKSCESTQMALMFKGKFRAFNPAPFAEYTPAKAQERLFAYVEKFLPVCGGGGSTETKKVPWYMAQDVGAITCQFRRRCLTCDRRRIEPAANCRRRDNRRLDGLDEETNQSMVDMHDFMEEGGELEDLWQPEEFWEEEEIWEELPDVVPARRTAAVSMTECLTNPDGTTKASKSGNGVQASLSIPILVMAAILSVVH